MYQRILVPVDGSPTSTRGLDEAIELARLTGAELRLVHVLDSLALASGAEFYAGNVLTVLQQAGGELLASARARVDAAGVPVGTVLLESMTRVCETIVDEAVKWKAELIVLGTHGRRGVGRMLLGSDAEQIVRSAPVPVLLVRSADAPPDAPHEWTGRVTSPLKGLLASA